LFCTLHQKGITMPKNRKVPAAVFGATGEITRVAPTRLGGPGRKEGFALSDLKGPRGPKRPAMAPGKRMALPGKGGSR
jgi:hypothetical protein